jgi:phosphatidylserine decarboxylase
MRSALHKLVAQEDLNFLLTNRLPRRLTTRFMGWFSKIENPVVRKTSIAAWKLFSDLDLSEAKSTKFSSMHDVFTRELKPGARPVDRRPTSWPRPATRSSARAGGSRATGSTR